MATIEPLVVRVMREFKAALLLREQAQEADMADRYLEVEERLQAHIDALAWDFAERREQGLTISEAALYRMERYKRLRALTEEEVLRYTGDYAEPLIRRGQAEMGQLGIDNAASAINASYGAFGGPIFERLPYEAIENMVGLAGDGSPLNTLLREAYPDAFDGVIRELIQSTAIGVNPRQTARRMRDGLGAGLNRALVIARSEQLRVYRQASAMQYERSGVVREFRRLATKDSRTCMACLVSDGERFPVGAVLSDHPNGRCAMVPVVIHARTPQWETSLQWFRQQDPEQQRGQMGAKYFEAWQDGVFQLPQLRSTVRSNVWGDSPQVTALNKLLN